MVRTNGRSTWQAMWGDFKVEQVYLTFPKSWSLPASSSSQVGSGHFSGVLPCPAHLLEPSFGGLRGAHLFGHCPHQGHCLVIRGGGSFKNSWGASVGNPPLLTMWGVSPLSAGGEAGAPNAELAPSDAPRGRGVVSRS